jgi:hypothetical protein
MTAVVGILNKQAVALAADSAVTIDGTNGRKIFNKANKVFTLSKFHPIGIMIHNSASFMTTPWETIIKMYRRQLGNRPFSTVAGYLEDFIAFVQSSPVFQDADLQKAFLQDFSLLVVNSVVDEVVNTHRNLVEDPTDDNRNAFLQRIEEKVDSFTGTFSTYECCPEFVNYSYESFAEYSREMINGIIRDKFISNGFILPAMLDEKIRRLILLVLKAKESLTNFTGLIFTGFGELEIYPKLIPINISMVVDDRLRYYVEEGRIATISNMNNATICPFAQTDVINTILSGVDPSLDNIYRSNFAALFDKYNSEILRIVGATNPEVTAQIRALNTQPLIDEYMKMNDRIKGENYIQPLMNAVASLSKEDLAEMAESLIYLTYLKRRITFAEESVGGPVDVAVISKGDGFVWIKRKLYFRPELNQHFFDNYFNQ